MSSPIKEYLSPNIYITDVEINKPIDGEEAVPVLSMHEVEKHVGDSPNQTPAEYLVFIEQEWKNTPSINRQGIFKKFEAKLPAILAAYEKQPELGEKILTDIFYGRFKSFGCDLILGDIANKETEEAVAAQNWQKALETYLLKVPELKGRVGELALIYASFLNTANSHLPVQQKLVEKLQPNFSHMDRYKSLKLLLMARSPIKNADTKEFCDLLEAKIDSLDFESLELCRERLLEFIKDPVALSLFTRICEHNIIPLNKNDVAFLNNFLDTMKNTHENCDLLLSYMFLRLQKLPAPQDPVVLSSIRDILFRIFLLCEKEKGEEERLIIAEKLLYILYKTTPDKTILRDLFPGVSVWREDLKLIQRSNKKKEVSHVRSHAQLRFLRYLFDSRNNFPTAFIHSAFLGKIQLAHNRSLVKSESDSPDNIYKKILTAFPTSKDMPVQDIQSKTLDYLKFCLRIPVLPEAMMEEIFIKLDTLQDPKYSESFKIEVAELMYELVKNKQIPLTDKNILFVKAKTPIKTAGKALLLIWAGVVAEMAAQRITAYKFGLVSSVEVSEISGTMVDAFASIIDKSATHDSLLKSTPFNDKIYKANVRMILDSKIDLGKTVGNLAWRQLSQHLGAEEFPWEMYPLLTDVYTEVQHNEVHPAIILDIAKVNFLNWNSLNVKPSTFKMLASLPHLNESQKVYAAETGLPALLFLHLKKHPAKKEEIESILQNICTPDTLSYLKVLTGKKSFQELFDDKMKAQKVELEGEINAANEALRLLNNSNIIPTDPIEVLAHDQRHKAEKAFHETCLKIAGNALKELEDLPIRASKWKKKKKRSFQKLEFARVVEEKQNLKIEASKKLKDNLETIERKVVYLKDVDQRLHTLEKDTRDEASKLIRTIEKKSGVLVKKIERQATVDIQSLFAEALAKNGSSYAIDQTTEASILNTKKSVSDKIQKFKEGLITQPTVISETDREKIARMKIKLKEEKESKKGDVLKFQVLLEEMERIKKQNTILQKRLEVEKLKNKNVIIESFEEKTLPELWEAVIEQAEFLQTSADPIISKKYAKVSAKLEKRDDTADKAYFEDLAKLCGIKKHRQNGTAHGQYDYKLSDGRTALDGTSTTISIHATQPKMCDKAIKELLISLLKVMDYESGLSA